MKKKIMTLLLISMSLSTFCFADGTAEIKLRFINKDGRVFFPSLKIYGYNYDKDPKTDSILIDSFNSKTPIKYVSEKISADNNGYTINGNSFYSNYLKVIAYYNNQQMTVFITLFYDCEVYAGCFQSPEYTIKFESGKSVIYLQEGLFRKDKVYLSSKDFKLFENKKIVTDEDVLFRRISESENKKTEQVKIDSIEKSKYKHWIYPLNSFALNQNLIPIGKYDVFTKNYYPFSNEFKTIVDKFYITEKKLLNSKEDLKIEIDRR